MLSTLKEVKNKKYHTVKTVPIFNRKIIERAKINTSKYMPAQFPGLVQALQ